MDTVFIVCTDSPTGEALKDYLEQHRYSVKRFQTLEEAQPKINGDSPCMIVFDVDAASYDLVRQLRLLWPNITMIACSYNDRPRESWKMWVDLWLKKPFDPKILDDIAVGRCRKPAV